jgi:hypothetical protein
MRDHLSPHTERRHTVDMFVLSHQSGCAPPPVILPNGTGSEYCLSSPGNSTLANCVFILDCTSPDAMLDTGLVVAGAVASLLMVYSVLRYLFYSEAGEASSRWLALSSRVASRVFLAATCVAIVVFGVVLGLVRTMHAISIL